MIQNLKRKNYDANILSEQIKRFRITVSPGELRMQRDLNDLADAEGLDFSYPGEPASVVIISDLQINCPNRFLLRVPRYYPHEKPKVRCLDLGFSHEYISLDGNITHPLLTSEWSAVYTVSDVIRAIQTIRLVYIKNNFTCLPQNEVEMDHVQS